MLSRHNECMKQRIFIGSDHAGLDLKQAVLEHLSESFDVVDCGPTSLDAHDDYPDYAAKVCDAVLEHGALGILICDTGIGMSMAANRYEGIRAALVTSPFMAERSRLHTDANVVCLGQENASFDESLELVDVWLAAAFTGDERHVRRLEKVDSIG